MAAEKAPRLERGEFRPPGPNDLRCPCPIMNSLANHGLIARDGRNITKAELKSALQYLGAGIDVATGLVNISFMAHCDDPDNAPPGTARSGLRDSTDVNEAGEPVLNLDKVGRPRSIEHDVFLTRQGRALGNYSHLDLDLYRQLVNYTRQQGALWIPQWGRYRKIRFNEQEQDDPQLDFPRQKHYVGCVEVAAMQCIFGKSWFSGMPVEHIEAIFGEERLPFREGWRPRRVKGHVLEVLIIIFIMCYYAWPYEESSAILGW